MSEEFIQAVKLGLSFGLRFKQMENHYRKLQQDAESLRNKHISSQVNSLSTQHEEYLCLFEDLLEERSEHVKEELNDVFEDLKDSKSEFVKLNSNVLNLKARKSKAGRKRKAKELPVCNEVPEDQHVQLGAGV
jgi:seryl-tRNA synthetase